MGKREVKNRMLFFAFFVVSIVEGLQDLVSCPSQSKKILATDPGKATVRTFLRSVPYSDNPKAFDKVLSLTATLNGKPVVVDRCHKLPIGSHKLLYTVTDEAGNNKQCTLLYDVEDKEAPTMSLCPKNITSFVYNSHTRRVTWLEPTVTDNSDGSNVKVTVTRKNGEYFSVGTHLVRYEIADKFGNKDSCEFYVTVKRTSKKLCSNLKPMGFSSALKPNCIAEGSSIPLYGVCVFTCPEGYLFKKTRARTATRYCKDHETWSGEDDVCIDLTPPRFTSCPSQKVLTTAFRSNVAKNVQWKTPTYYDNSVPVEGDQLTLVEKNGYTSPRDFGIGEHRIEYTVTDKSGLKSFCYFTIIVKDNEAPYYTNCPEDIVKTHDYSNPWGRMRITWGHPWFKDNSGEYPHVVASYANGHLFKIGQHQVVYTAIDGSGNRNNSCSFQVIIKELCNTRTAPKNGALACFEGGVATYCNLFCQDGYEFSYKPEGTYFCYRGVWKYWRGFYQILISKRQEWPDCVARQDPSSGNLKMSQSFYYQGDCFDKKVQHKLKSNFHNFLRAKSPPFTCRVFGAKCNPASITIHCGAKDAY